METETGAEFISPTHVRHILRYVETAKHVAGKTLDACCGTGYGTAILAKVCDVEGIDFSADAIAEAIKTYPSIRFRCMDIKTILDKYDSIVFIEAIEHFTKEEGQEVLKYLRWLLQFKGTLILTTPYCTTTGPSNITKQHLCEYSLTDLEILLADCGFEIDFIKLTRHLGQEGRLGYAFIKARACG
jgi:cyclopropane fatty-acyl-phospholipid synthase-like methyltransferase